MAKIKQIARRLENGTYEYVSLGASKTSELDNDSGFIAKDVSNLTNYYTKTEVDSAIAAGGGGGNLSAVALQPIESLQ